MSGEARDKLYKLSDEIVKQFTLIKQTVEKYQEDANFQVDDPENILLNDICKNIQNIILSFISLTTLNEIITN